MKRDHCSTSPPPPSQAIQHEIAAAAALLLLRLKPSFQTPPDGGVGEGRAAKRKKEEEEEEDASARPSIGSVLYDPALFMEVAGYLPWKDATVLGSASRGCRHAYLENSEAILGPVLAVLEALCQSNVHHAGCGKIMAPASRRECTCGPPWGNFPRDDSCLSRLDPRYNDGDGDGDVEAYDSLSTPRKCGEMVLFLATLVANMRPHLNNFADLANRLTPTLPIQSNWQNRLFDLYRANGLSSERVTLASNLVRAFCADQALLQGGDVSFNSALVGNGIRIDTRDSLSDRIYREALEMRPPYTAEELKRFLREHLLPSADTLALLGPALSSRVLLCAPLLEWIDGEGEIALPIGLDAFAEEDGLPPLELRRAFDWYLDPIDGRGEDLMHPPFAFEVPGFAEHFVDEDVHPRFAFELPGLEDFPDPIDGEGEDMLGRIDGEGEVALPQGFF